MTADVTFDGNDPERSLGTDELSGDLANLEAQVCGLGGATHVQTWGPNHTHTADISIADHPQQQI
jgi:hypothetical protein